MEQDRPEPRGLRRRRTMQDGTILTCLHMSEPPPSTCPVCAGGSHRELGVGETRLVGYSILAVGRAELDPSPVRPTEDVLAADWIRRLMAIGPPYTPPARRDLTIVPRLDWLISSLRSLAMFLLLPIHRVSSPVQRTQLYRWLYSTVEILYSLRHLVDDGVGAIREGRPMQVSLDDWLRQEWPRLRTHIPSPRRRW